MSNPTLAQMNAVKKGLTGRTEGAVTQVHRDLGNAALYAGLTRTYKPRDEDGDKFPSEYTRVQQNVHDRLHDVADLWTKLFDAILTVDEGNTVARGVVRIGGDEILSAPVPFLLTLEKKLVDFRTIVSKLPVLDPAVNWEPDTSGNAQWRSQPETTVRTRKVPKVLVKAEATDKHPAQTEVYNVDEPVGEWEVTKFSNALSATRRAQLVDRADSLIDAVKRAIHEANATEIEQKHVGTAVFSYLLA